MSIDDAIRKRINELVETNKTTLTALCLNSNLTPVKFINIIGDIPSKSVCVINKFFSMMCNYV